MAIRQAPARNLATACFGTLWCAGLASVGTSLIGQGLWFVGVMPLGAALLGGAMFWRIVTAAVTTSAVGLRVRNIGRTRTVPWAAVDEIRLSRRGASWRRGLEVALRDGETIWVDVLSARDALPGMPAGRRLDAALDALVDRYRRSR